MKNHYPILLLPLLLFLGCNSTPKKAPHSPKKTSYTWINTWPETPAGYIMGNATGLGIDPNQNIVVFHRGTRGWREPMFTNKICENTISVFDSNTGKLLKSWGSDLFIMPHGLEIDNEGNVWVTDVGLHQVFKFNADGELLMTLGEAQRTGNDTKHFNLPTDIAVAPDGTFYVSDGYGNSRIVKFSAQGEYLFEWGYFWRWHWSV